MRKGDWFQTYSGVAFYPLDPHVDDIVRPLKPYLTNYKELEKKL